MCQGHVRDSEGSSSDKIWSVARVRNPDRNLALYGVSERACGRACACACVNDDAVRDREACACACGREQVPTRVVVPAHTIYTGTSSFPFPLPRRAFACWLRPVILVAVVVMPVEHHGSFGKLLL